MAAESTPFDIEEFRNGLGIKILECCEERVVLQLRGCDASLANAIRRILISEVPTVALETIQVTLKPEPYTLDPGKALAGLCWALALWCLRCRRRTQRDISPLSASAGGLLSVFVSAQMWQNTGVVQDEVLAHRLGLIPFRVNPEKLKFRGPTQELGEDNALKLRLHVKCTPNDLKPYQKSMPGTNRGPRGAEFAQLCLHTRALVDSIACGSPAICGVETHALSFSRVLQSTPAT